MDRRGILAGGNFIVDVVKIIDLWPPQESLANIIHQYSSNGGGAYNLLKDLAAMQVGFPLQAVGLVGNDYWGNWIKTDCIESGIDVTQLQMTTQSYTSFTDVMTLEKGGKRTFFHYRGANAWLERSHFHLEKSNARIFHLAYMLLLDKLDLIGEQGVSEAAKLLQDAGSMGFICSADLVSVHDDRFRKLILSALSFIDILFLNEFEAEKITGIKIISDGMVQLNQAMIASQQILQSGVRQWVLLHFPEGAVALSSKGELIQQGSLMLPPDLVVGAVGAGDAFAAGVLAAYHDSQPMEEALKLGVCAAAASLTHATCSGGIMTIADCLKLGERFSYRTL